MQNCDLRILNGRTKGDSLGRATFHGISVVDYILCDQELFQKTNYFVVKPPTYLYDHSQIVAWVDIRELKICNAAARRRAFKTKSIFIEDNNYE